LPLAQADTYYVNYSAPGTDVGFDVGAVHFECLYDTAWGGSWSGGFAYSNMKDSATSGYMNQYAAKPGTGFDSSDNYAVFFRGYGFSPKIRIAGAAAVKQATGFYITNSTYAFNSMRDGDFVAKKFGGATGNDPDWFRLMVQGYRNGQLLNDSVLFYLADFRDSNNATDYIVNDWRWVDLTPLGNVDSLEFSLSSSDNGQFGMNTPAYFCMDNFTTLIVTDIKPSELPVAKIYPNPATDVLFVELNDPQIKMLSVSDALGKTIISLDNPGAQVRIPTGTLSPGHYYLRFTNGTQQGYCRFIKH